MQSQIETYGGRYDVSPELTPLGDDVVMLSAQWLETGGVRDRRYVVLTLRDGMIADMQVCGTLRQAKRFARSRRKTVAA